MLTLGIPFENVVAMPNKQKDKKGEQAIHNWTLRDGADRALTTLRRNPNVAPVIFTYHDLAVVRKFLNEKVSLLIESYIPGITLRNEVLYLCNRPYQFESILVPPRVVVTQFEGWNRI